MPRLHAAVALCLFVAASAQDRPTPASAALDALDALAAGRIPEARAALTRALEQDGDNATWVLWRGAASLFGQEVKAARTDLQRALRLRPGHQETRLFLAAAERMAGDLFTETWPQATNDPFESRLGQLCAEIGGAERSGETDERSVQDRTRRLAALRVEWARRGQEQPALGAVLATRALARLAAGQHAAALADLQALAARGATTPQLLGAEAECRLALGDAAGARALFTRALTADPRLVRGYLGRALAAARLGDGRRAQADLTRAEELEPKASEPACAAVAAALAESARDPATPELGIAALRTAAQDDGAEFEQLVQLALGAQRAQGRIRRRLDERYQDELFARERAVAEGPRDAERHAGLAAFLYREATPLGERVAPRGDAVLYRWQTATSRAAELRRAESVADQALALDARCTTALLVKAAVRIAHLQYGDAESLLRQALRLDATRAEALELLSEVMDVAAQQKAAFAASLRTRKFLGSTTETRGDHEIRTSWWREPTAEELARAAELQAEAQRCLDLAVSQLERAAQARAGTAEGAFYRGLLLRRTGQPQDALTSLRDCVRLDPDHALGWFQIAGVCAELGQGQEAVRARATALNLRHTSAAPWLAAAWPLVVRTAFQGAGQALDLALRLDPVDARIAAWNGVVAGAQEQTAAARAWFRIALALEEAAARAAGTSLLATARSELTAEQVGLTLALRRRLGAVALAANAPERALEEFQANLALEPRLSRDMALLESPRAMLPDPSQGQGEVPLAEHALLQIAWSRVGAGQALLDLGRAGQVDAVVRPVRGYGPALVNGRGADRFRLPELHAALVLGKAALAQGDFATARQWQQLLPRKRHGVGPSKGIAPELEDASQALDELLSRGEERTDRPVPQAPMAPDDDAVERTLATLARDLGLVMPDRRDPRADGIDAVLTSGLRNLVVATQTRADDASWRFGVLRAVSGLIRLQDQWQQQAQALRRQLDGAKARPRANPRTLAGLEQRVTEAEALAGKAAAVVTGARRHATAMGYPADRLERDLAGGR